MSIVTQPLLPPYHLEVSVVSEKGTSHDVNEDAYRIDLPHGLFLLADGMGGHQAGEVASRLAVEVLYETLMASAATSFQEMLGTALLAAHQAIRSLAAEEEIYRGMGTTALIGWVRIPQPLLWTGHVGNSRAYLWRNGKLKQLTEDHTMLNELRKANRLPPDPKDWPPSTVLSQALGSRQPFLAPQFGEWVLQIGDRLLFCSDGISDVLTDNEINQILLYAPSPQQACEYLQRATCRKGARDDFTAIVVNIEGKPREPLQTAQALEVER